MTLEPRLRVSTVLRWEGRILLCRHEKPGGESLVEALRRELEEEVAIGEDLTFEGPVAVVDSIAPKRPLVGRHVVHIIFGADLSGRSLERVTSTDAAVRGHRLFDPADLDEVVLHPPIQRFLGRWQPGDPAVYLGALWAP